MHAELEELKIGMKMKINYVDVKEDLPLFAFKPMKTSDKQPGSLARVSASDPVEVLRLLQQGG